MLTKNGPAIAFSLVMALHVTLTFFGDYECPYSARAYRVIRQLQEELNFNFKVEFKYFPLTDIHPHALMAAEAAEAARNQGKFEEMHDALFANQAKLNPMLIAQIAAGLNMDLDRFSQDWKSHTYISRIQNDIDEGFARGVHRTPTFFINGKPFEKQWSLASLRAGVLNVDGELPGSR